jgi:uncharacterized protein (UPF0335 family)
MARKGNGKNIGAAQELKNIVERIVALDIEAKQSAKEFADDIDDVYKEAESKGYDKKALKIAVRRRHESAEQRAKRLETEAIADMYAAAIGDLAGKPLDDLTRRRIDEQMRKAQPPAEPDPQNELPPEATAQPEPAETPEQAKEKGKQARNEGQRIVDNPYHSSSPLRAMWDEGWCEEDGSDGMDVPAAWKRSKPPEDEKKDGEGGGDKKPPPPAGDDGAGASAS